MREKYLNGRFDFNCRFPILRQFFCILEGLKIRLQKSHLFATFFVVMHFLRLFLVKLYDFFLRELKQTRNFHATNTRASNLLVERARCVFSAVKEQMQKAAILQRFSNGAWVICMTHDAWRMTVFCMNTRMNRNTWYLVFYSVLIAWSMTTEKLIVI